MKKVILITLLAAFSMATFAQQHLTFKGVPINGTLKEYTEAMKAKGFTYIGEEDGISALQGDFAGYKIRKGGYCWHDFQRIIQAPKESC